MAHEPSTIAGDRPADETAVAELHLPAVWRAFDRGVILAAKVLVVAIGVVFTGAVLLEVASRFFLNISVAQANSVSRFLLVWFFMVGAGLALRTGGHVALEFFVRRLPEAGRRVFKLLVQLLLLAFFGMMAFSGWRAFLSSLSQVDAALPVSMGWVMVAFPIGFSLLAYHQIALLVDHLRAPNRTVS